MNRKVLRIVFFSQVIYYGGYSGEDPPLPIPNREVKLTIADGTDLPVGRVGSCRFWKPGRHQTPGLLRFRSAQTQKRRRCRCLTPALRAAPRGDRGKTPGPPPVTDMIIRRRCTGVEGGAQAEFGFKRARAGGNGRARRDDGVCLSAS